MPDTDTMHDHYTVVSIAAGVRTARIVIAGNSFDAAETHRVHYGGDIVSVFDSRQAS